MKQDKKLFKKRFLEAVFRKKSYFFSVCKSLTQRNPSAWNENNSFPANRPWSKLEQFFDDDDFEILIARLQGIDGFEVFMESLTDNLYDMVVADSTQPAFMTGISRQAEVFVDLVFASDFPPDPADQDAAYLALPGENDPDLKELIAEVTTHEMSC